MRIRKILPLALLAIGLLFALTSCDKLLDAIFSSNTISVSVKVFAGTHPSYWAGGYVGVVVTGGGTISSATQSSTYLDGSGYVNYSFSFPKLPDGTYTIVTTYYDGLGGSASTNQFYDPTNAHTTLITMPYTSGGSEKSVSVWSYLN